ncbi:LacI family DNA-binding transcriptional regulator [Jannaschia donghaensis]|uniref:Gluconate utilization system GNT-I transcriptional repressor n=1 Tax=Jannaschia donghaensis TaxID=420998 RepID=A0A0M6YQB6_9RHOB|nr:LacI family DNA-binding transcriptional regulator [Jannaschia donghaensis]CTQ51196.1 Gluconate utilization system GNT-I transcriptional repressor [Jannaschia donghaensis]
MARRPRDTTSGIYAVAAEAGVSVMTVSRAMRGVEGVSSVRRDAILQIARRLNYVPNSAARALSQTNADLVGISVPNLLNDVFADVLQGMRGTIQRAGYSTVIDTTEYDAEVELRWVSRILSWRPAAMILTGIDHHPDLRPMLRDAGIPTLETWDFSSDPIDICVGLDHVAAGADVARYVQDLGYVRPAFVGARVGTDPRADARVRGLEQVWGGPIARAGAAPENAFRMGADGMRTLMADHAPDVVFFLNDLMAFGGMTVAAEMGLDVPGDIGIVGFNALGLNTVLPVPLTTVSTPRRQMGVMGARNLLARMHGVAGARAVALPVKVQPGGTTRPQGRRLQAGA